MPILFTLSTTQPFSLRRGYRLQWEDAQQGWVLLFPEGMIQLNESAGLILQEFLQPRSIDDVIHTLEQRFPDADIRADILEFVQDAHDQRWLQSAN